MSSKEMPLISTIDQVIDAACENGISGNTTGSGTGTGSNSNWILRKSQILISRKRPREAIRLIMNDGAAKFYLFTGAYPCPKGIIPSPSPVTCTYSQLNAALPNTHLLSVAKALTKIDCLTQAKLFI
jgi:hypothetical protein